jgi:hypothetical protein
VEAVRQKKPVDIHDEEYSRPSLHASSENT